MRVRPRLLPGTSDSLGLSPASFATKLVTGNACEIADSCDAVVSPALDTASELGISRARSLANGPIPGREEKIR
jgi:hypothetical protein